MHGTPLESSQLTRVYTLRGKGLSLSQQLAFANTFTTSEGLKITNPVTVFRLNLA